MFRCLCAAAVAVACLAAVAPAAPAPFARPHRKHAVDDITRMQGTWKVLQYGSANQKGAALARLQTQMKVRIDANKWTFQHNTGNAFRDSASYEITLPGKGNPRQLDMTYTPPGYTLTMKGIYQFEGNKLKVAYVSTYTGARFGRGGLVPAQQKRPTSFGDLPAGTLIMTLERE